MRALTHLHVKRILKSPSVVKSPIISLHTTTLTCFCFHVILWNMCARWGSFRFVCLGEGGDGCWLAASQGLNCSVLLVTFFVVYFYKEKICLSLLSVFLLSATTTTTPGWGILFIFCFSPSAVHVEEHLLFLEVKCSLLCWKCSRQIHSTCVRFVDACGWCQSGQDLVQFGYKVSTNSTNVVETDTFHDSGILFIESIWR